jgi:hypothetical protein
LKAADFISFIVYFKIKRQWLFSQGAQKDKTATTAQGAQKRQKTKTIRRLYEQTSNSPADRLALLICCAAALKRRKNNDALCVERRYYSVRYASTLSLVKGN